MENSRRTRKSFSRSSLKLLDTFRKTPKHNSPASHEIEDLTRKYGFKIFQSYLENKTLSAGRMSWAYRPDKGDITILAVGTAP